MAFLDLVRKNRSIRRFDEHKPISREALLELIELARLCPSAANLQPLKYIISFTKEKNVLIFPALSWAAYLSNWGGPKEGERPAAYIIILGDKNISANFNYDCGIASQTILLGAVEKGLGGCMLASINRELLRKNLSIPEHLDILLVIALGEPGEKVILEDKKPGADIKYYRDANGQHHVPKRPLNEILID